MLRDIYVRPIGLMPAGQTASAREATGSLPLAGGWLDFSALQIIERNGAHVDRYVTGLGDFLERDWGRRTLQAADLFEAMRAPRARMAGLALDRPRIMGIVNVTPDSFSDGGRLGTVEAAVARGLALGEEGADILDVGGESTRPGSDAIGTDEEIRRVIPVIERLRAKTDLLISVDTRKPEVMRAAHQAGADLVNDVSALMFDRASLETAAELGLPVILMHAQGDPKTMQQAPHYGDVLLEVFDHLEARIEACIRAGIGREKLIVDPGLGFGKTFAHNLALMSGLTLFHALGVPLLLGASRKSFIGKLSGVDEPSLRMAGSVAAALHGVSQGAQLLRVHDVEATRQAITVWSALQ